MNNYPKKTNINLHLPKKIHNYIFVKEINKNKKTNDYLVGIYEKKGKQYFAKLYFKKGRDYHLAAIRNEIAIYHSLNEVYTRVKKHIPSRLSNIKIPKIVNSFESKEFIVYFTEYIEGKLVDFNRPNGFGTYKRIIDLLSFLYSKMNSEELDRIPCRTPLQVVMIYYLVLVIAIAKRLGLVKELIHGAVIFSLTVPLMLLQSKKSFVHRDLYNSNVIYSGNNYYVLDFQFSAVSHPVHEYTHTLRSKCGNTFKDAINDYVQKSGGKKLFKASVIYSMTHVLSSQNNSAAVKWWSQNLVQAIRS